MLLFCDWKRKSTERKEKKTCPFFVKVSQVWSKKGIGRERRRIRVTERSSVEKRYNSVITQHQINNKQIQRRLHQNYHNF